TRSYGDWSSDVCSSDLWFRHLVYAPGRLTGYGVKTLPRVEGFAHAGQRLHSIAGQTARRVDEVPEPFAPRQSARVRESVLHALRSAERRVVRASLCVYL